MAKTVFLSVHDIVDTLFRRGHLDTRIFNQASMLEGTRLHSMYQKMQSDNYISEYSLSDTFIYSDYKFIVSGKADGVIISNDEIVVEEIKTTVADLNQFFLDHGEWHLAQAMFYAYILAKQKNRSFVKVILTYLKQQNFRNNKKVEKVYSFSELKTFVNDAILRYTQYLKKIEKYKEIRDESIPSVSFPFTTYRKGQKELIDYIDDKTSKDQELFIQAPTGTGKTVSVLYPLIKKFGKKVDRIYYLTSKNSIKKIAVDTLILLKEQGLKAKVIEFTSKKNICFNDKKGHCNPDECPFAKNYYDKLLETIYDALAIHDIYDRKTIEDICYEKNMCPYQFMFDLSRFCDVIICDYSYIYDYNDTLALEENIKVMNCHLLVDECHNLPDRVKEMYSIELSIEDLTKSIAYCQDEKLKHVKNDLKDIISYIEDIDISEQSDEERKANICSLESINDRLIDLVYEFLSDMKSVLLHHAHVVNDEFMDYYFMLHSFYYLNDLILSDELKNDFMYYVRTDKDNDILSLKIVNLNPRNLILSCSNLFKSVVYFSATLSPSEYYIDLLGGNAYSNTLFLPSPFDLANCRVYFDFRYSLRFKDRDENLYQVFQTCKSALSSKKGNYFIFCPSFDYLYALNNFFRQEPLEKSVVIPQGRYMDEKSRNEFLLSFQSDNDKTTIGLLVQGGIFSEGIDLIGDRLIGAIVISIGLPQVSYERNKMKDYFTQEKNSKDEGFNYAYSYPGINKVLQSSGRVIRSESDKGFIIYIDSRFKQSLYVNIFKNIYPQAKRIISNAALLANLKEFWKEEK